MKKTIRDFNLKEKKVIIRVDFNVPIKDNTITDDTRIKESLETIKYALESQAKVILMSHLGRIENKEDLSKNSLEIVSKRLKELLNKDIIFIDNTRGKELEDAINNLKNGEILLMQNTRYEDIEGKKESNNDSELGKYWASLGDIFINDAFGTSHRAHASNVGIATHLPSGIGFLVEKELNEMEKVLENPVRPYTVILGGAKVSDKIGVIEALAKKADYILIGGAMAYTFLSSLEIDVGKSLIDQKNINFCRNILEKYSGKIILPIDAVVSNNSQVKETFIANMEENDIGLDIGYNTVKLFRSFLIKSKTIVWNGPVGMFEREEFSIGTKSLCEIMTIIEAKKIAGGGDTASAIINFGYKDAFTHISTGGGASLELLEGKKLPGVEIIDEK